MQMEKMTKRRRIRFYFREVTEDGVIELLRAVDDYAVLYWIGYDLWHMIHGTYFRNIRLSDTYGYICSEMVVRYDHIADMVTIDFHKWLR